MQDCGYLNGFPILRSLRQTSNEIAMRKMPETTTGGNIGPFLAEQKMWNLRTYFASSPDTIMHLITLGNIS